MVVPFEKLGPESRIWIYQSNRPLDDEQQKFILDKAEHFLSEWTAHGNDLETGIKIFYNQFVVVAVDESYHEASGCSIDKSVAFIRELGNSLQIDFLDRSQVAMMQGTKVVLVPFTEIKNSIAAGQITPEAKVFNHAVVTKKALYDEWMLPADKSWIKRHFFVQK